MTLEATNISRRFGNVVALNGVTSSLRPGEVHGLIGPNGSGKTTLLNILSGFYPCSEGSLAINGVDITRRSVEARPDLGISRTFQKPRVLKTLTVIENAALGGWHLMTSGFLGAALQTPGIRHQQKALREKAGRLLDGLGMSNLKENRADLLGHAEQRLLEIARSLCASPSFLLLDEPAGGLTGQEIANLESIIRAIASAGIGVLLVEHHMDLVFRISDRVTALDLGKVIASGTPSEIQRDENVRRVYLGL